MTEISKIIDDVLARSTSGLTVQQLRRELRNRGYAHLTESQIERILQSSQRYVHVGGLRFHLRGYEPEVAEQQFSPPEDDPTPLPTIPNLRDLADGYVVFDIETTGTTIGTDTVLQLAALKIRNHNPVAAFSEWINPRGATIPFAVRQLLRLEAGSEREQVLISAPSLEEVVRRFREFLEELPVVAHNGVQFDAPFLKALVPDLDLMPFDTLELCALAFPTEDSWSLESLTNAEETSDCLRAVYPDVPVGYHDALFDCAATHLLLQKGVSRLSAMDLEIKATVAALLPEISGLLGADAPGHARFLAALNPSSLSANELAATGNAFDIRWALDRFTQHIANCGLSPRPGQSEMVRLVCQALSAPSFKMIESPTGTGKSLALAFPAALFSTTTGNRVAITTRTKNLQTQLINDLEAIRQSGSVQFEYQVVRGRENYVCLTAFQEQLDSVDATTDPRVRFTLATVATRLWATRQDPNSCGLLTSLEHGWASRRFGRRFRAALNSIRSRSGVCTESSCRQYGGCYSTYVMRRAAGVHVAVLNHSLWLMASARLPEVCAVLVDEAHNLEDAATEAASEAATRNSILDLLYEMLSPDNHGLLPALRHAGASSPEPSLQQLLGIARAARGQLDVFGEQLGRFLERCGVDLKDDYPVTFRIRTDLHRQEPARHRIVLDALDQMINSYLAPLVTGTTLAGASIRDRNPELAASTEDVASRLQGQVDIMKRLSSAVGTNTVRWLEYASPDDVGHSDWALKEAPISVSETMQPFYDAIHTAVFTSATLTTDRGDFTLFLNRLGLLERIPESGRHVMDSNLPYGNALFLIPRYFENTPSPARMRFFVEELCAELERLFGFTNGHAMALMTARKRMETVFESAGPVLAGEGISLLAQDLSCSAEQLVIQLRNQPAGTAVMGVGKLWEGVDVPGEALSVLVIEKLPFPSFNDPVTQARREAVVSAGGSDFFDYLLPWTLIRFKQGFGRLIRGANDRGVVILLDRRIHHKSYKPQVLNCLPGYTADPDCEGSRAATYRAIANHLPALFEGRNLQSLLAALPEDVISRVEELLAEWSLTEPMNQEDYENARSRILELMAEIYRFESFKSDEQEEIVKQILLGHDVIGILPTGSGKSLAFQLPSLLTAGLTLVVSPLIALMRDQISRLHTLGLSTTEALFSGQSPDEREDALKRLRDGRIRILYSSPERLRDPRLRRCLAEVGIQRLVVDEAHCVSMWGASFRPEYLSIRSALPSGVTQVAALTATATPEIESDIVSHLDMSDPVVVRATADRPELWFGVFNSHTLGWPIHKARDKFHALTAIAKIADRDRSPMIVYVATTVTAEEVARKLAALGYDARYYHGKMSAEDRSDAQELFMEDIVNILVATKAFGMGIDKPDIRYVVHYDMPSDLESYYQEAGRAGRDGQESYALLLYHDADIYTQEYFLENGLISSERLRILAEHIRPWIQDGRPFLVKDFDLDDWQEYEINLGIYCLEQCEYLERLPDVTVSASILLYMDRHQACSAISSVEPTVARDAATVLEALDVRAYERVNVDLTAIATTRSLTLDQVADALEALSDAEILRYRPWERGPLFRPGRAYDSHSVRLPDYITGYIGARRQKLEQMIRYAARTEQCRRQSILRYLGEQYSGPCGNCDVCVPHKQLPWSSLRRADVPNPADFFDPSLVIMQVIEENVVRAQCDGKAPYGRSTLKYILTGNEFMALGREEDPYLRSWRRRRVRAFPQWGLLSSMRAKDAEIDKLIDQLIAKNLVKELEAGSDSFVYRYLELTALGERALETGKL